MNEHSLIERFLQINHYYLKRSRAKVGDSTRQIASMYRKYARYYNR